MYSERDILEIFEIIEPREIIGRLKIILHEVLERIYISVSLSGRYEERLEQLAKKIIREIKSIEDYSTSFYICKSKKEPKKGDYNFYVDRYCYYANLENLYLMFLTLKMYKHKVSDGHFLDFPDTNQKIYYFNSDSKEINAISVYITEDIDKSTEYFFVPKPIKFKRFEMFATVDNDKLMWFCKDDVDEKRLNELKNLHSILSLPEP